MRTFHLERPDTVAQAVRLLDSDPEAKVIAGGTDLVALMKEGIETPGRLVDVAGLDLAGITRAPDGTITLGALATNSDTARTLRERTPVLSEAIRSGASAQIRNMATTAGNLLQGVRCPYYRQTEFACNRRDPGSGCASIEGANPGQALFGTSSSCIAVHPSDMAVALLALDAVVLVQGPDGRREIPLGSFHRLPGDTPERQTELRRAELIVGVRIGAQPRGRRSHYVKFRERTSYAFALVSGAVVVDLDGRRVRSARIALGGVAPRPWRAEGAERALVGRTFDAEAIEDAADAATEGARPQRDNAYKVELVRGVVRRALTEVAA
ncbi:xanthine dehydrogenase family protein subunit M [Streptomyces sp. NPDC004610]|uniref:FAD binding domain-containing protein n=1 Tax=unclassified Streptomyces TaxID=2593676 RepID=UPI0033BE9556